VFDTEEVTDVLEGFGDVTGAVVGEDLLSPYAVFFEPRDGAAKKRGSCGSSLISEYLRIGEPRGIIDGDVDELPTDPSGTFPLVSCDPMADAAYLAELLDVEVE